MRRYAALRQNQHLAQQPLAGVREAPHRDG